MNSPFLSILQDRLRFWSLHCLINALPSFCIALIYLHLWLRPEAIVAMLLAILTFIIVYSVLTSVKGPLSDNEHTLFQALRLGTKFRAGVSGVSLLSIPVITLNPDFWAGFYAAVLYQQVAGRFMGLPADLIENPHKAGAVEIYFTTMLEGLILSSVILVASFFCILIVQARKRKQAFLRPDPRGVDGI